MQLKPIAFFLASIIALLLSFTFAFFFPLPNLFSAIPISLLVIGFFLMGFSMFGFFSFIPHIFFGLALGSEKNASIFIYLAPILLATYAGTKMAGALLDDINLKKYFLEEGKTVLILLISAIALALLIEFSLPLLLEMNIIPTDIWGMNVKEGEQVTSMIDQLIKLRR